MTDFLQELQALVSGAGSEVRYDHTAYSNKVDMDDAALYFATNTSPFLYRTPILLSNLSLRL